MIRAGEYPPLRLIAGWDGKPLRCCDVCGCDGVAADHVPGDEVCRYMRARVSRNSAPRNGGVSR